MIPMLMAFAAQEDQVEQEPTGERKREAPPKPDQDELLTDVDEVVRFWSERDQQMDEDLSLYRMSDQASGDGEVVRRNIPRVMVDKATNMIAAAKYTTKHMPLREEHFDTSQDIEEFLKWCWYLWDRRWRRSQMQQSIEYAMAHYGTLRGYISLRVKYDPEKDDDFDLPIDVIPYDPRTVYPALGSNGLTFVVHRYEITIYQLLREWPEAQESFGEREGTESVEVKAYYDDWWHAVWVEDQLIKPLTAHEYARNPWVIVPCLGSSIRATDADEQEWTRYAGVSIFDSIRYAYQQMNRTLSHLATAVARQANPAKIYYMDPTTGEPEEIDLQDGTTNYVWRDENVDVVQLGLNPGDVTPMLDLLDDDVQKGALPSALWGVGANQTGFGLSVMTDAARDQLYAVIDAVQEAKSQVNELCLRIIRDLHDEPIGFWSREADGPWKPGKVIHPSDIEEAGVFTEVKYSDIMPKDRVAMANLGIMLKEANLLDPTTVRESYLEIENPDKVQDRLLHDMIYMDEETVKNVFVPLSLFRTDPELFQVYLMSKLMAAGGPGALGSGGQPGADSAPSGPVPGGPGSPPPPALPPPASPGGLAPRAPQPGGLAPETLPPVAQPGANPLVQALGSALGGAGLSRPPGAPGAGALPVRLPPR